MIDFFAAAVEEPPKSERVDAACLSQWFPRAFTVDGPRYATAEHFMMAEKARLFRDQDALPRILEAKSPAEAKALGRAVRGFDPDAWESARWRGRNLLGFALMAARAQLA